jgi:hypothetical protein
MPQEGPLFNPPPDPISIAVRLVSLIKAAAAFFKWGLPK